MVVLDKLLITTDKYTHPPPKKQILRLHSAKALMTGKTLTRRVSGLPCSALKSTCGHMTGRENTDRERWGGWGGKRLSGKRGRQVA